jgi:pimeloyl-ACP methyl ester carboxylesterase
VHVEQSPRANVELGATPGDNAVALAGLAGDIEGDPDKRPPLVLLHGLTFDRTIWQPALKALRSRDPGRQVLALDLPGHGDSPEQDSYDLAAVADTVRFAVEDAGLAPPIIAGHSIAALIATIYASRYPARGVINVDQSLATEPFARMLRARAEQLTGPGFPAIWERLLESMHIELLPEPAQHLVRSTSRPRQHIVLGYWHGVLNASDDELKQRITDTLSELRDAGVPYHLVSGSELQPDYEKWLKRMLPNATVTTLPHSGHFPHLVHPHRFADLLASTGQLRMTHRAGPNAQARSA